MPHFSSECLEIIGVKIDSLEWPKHDEKFVEDAETNVVIQVNGKKRGLIKVKKDTKEDSLVNIIKKDQKISKFIDDKVIKKQIFIKNKILNFII